MTETTDEAQKLLDSRRAVYGDRIDNMERTAKIWSGLIGFEIQPWQVPLMFSAYKMFRAMIAPDYSDNIDDVDGWNKMFREIIGTDLIQARTVEEYLEEKDRRVRTALPKIPPVDSALPGSPDTPQAEGQLIDLWMARQHSAVVEGNPHSEFLAWLTREHNITLASIRHGNGGSTLEWISIAEIRRYIEEYSANNDRSS